MPRDTRLDDSDFAPHLSVVAPVYNEAECIEELVTETVECLRRNGMSFELICIDDGSTDTSCALLRRLALEMIELRPACLDRHHGQSASLAAGIALARGSVVALMDADLQNDPSDIGPLVARLEAEGWDCVAGVRARRQDSWLRRISSRIAKRVGAIVTGQHVRDAGCGLKVARTQTLKAVTFFRGAHRFIIAMLRMEGARVLEVDVNHRPRPRGRSKYGRGLGRTFVALTDAFGVRWMDNRKLRFSVKPIERGSP